MHTTASQGFQSEWGVGGQSAQAGEEVHSNVGPAGMGLLRQGETNRGAQDGPSGVCIDKKKK